ncbi:MAG: helicase C-terminal domain-containing protein [Armatimonadota bacterium]
MPVIEIGVHDFLALTLKLGGLGAGAPSRGQLAAGIAAHSELALRRPEGYQREAGIGCAFEWGDYRLVVRGRIDGLLEDDAGLLVEEVKTTYRPLDRVRPEDHPYHLAQLQLYHHFICARRPGARVRPVLTYVCVPTGAERAFPQSWTPEESRRFFEELALALLRAEEDARCWRKLRDESLQALRFPFPELREGQAELMAAVAGAINGRHDLLVEAATGIGKTLGALFPVILGLAEDCGYARIFYLTAKSSGAEVVRDALSLLRAQGLRLRALYLTAKERICPYAGPHRPECDAVDCPCAVDFFPRAAKLLPELLHEEEWTPEFIAEAAKREELCPFELALELSLHADIIVGDYNYVFDPNVYLRRFFWPGRPADSLFIVDEAHNLVTRAREMYSAALEEAELKAILDLLPDPTLRACAMPLQARCASWREDLSFDGAKAMRLPELPADFGPELDGFLNALGDLLAVLPRGATRTGALERYFELIHCSRIAAGLSADDAVYVSKAGKAATKLRLFCPHPGQQLRRRLNSSTAAVFLSATLSPPEFFRELLGAREGAEYLSLPSPFPPEHRLYLHVPGVSTRYTKREETKPTVAKVVLDTARAHPGNYLAFFPSYAYLGAVWAEIMVDAPRDLYVHAQKPNMRRDEQVTFLQEVCALDGNAHLGLAVMGGLFGEAVDLPGERLVGVIIVGPALPSINPEQELIREYFDERDGEGYYHAYIVPGIIRVVQAAGRVFRTPEDRGVVVLMDDRFLEEPYRGLLPEDWCADDAEFSTEAYQERLKQFWRKPQGLSRP